MNNDLHRNPHRHLHGLDCRCRRCWSETDPVVELVGWGIVALIIVLLLLGVPL